MAKQRKFLTDPDGLPRRQPRQPEAAHARRARPSSRPGSRRRPGGWRSSATGRAELEQPRRLDDGTALDLPALLELGKTARRASSSRRCSATTSPSRWARGCGRACRCATCSRWRQDQATSAASTTGASTTTTPSSSSARRWRYNQVLDTPPGELPPFVAYRLNGEPIPLDARRAGAHGRAVGARVQVDQVAPAHRADQRLQGQRHLRRARTTTPSRT